MDELFLELKQAIIDGDEEIVGELSQKVIDESINPVDAVQLGLIKGIEVVGELWKAGEVFLPDVMMSAEAMKVGLGLLEPEIAKLGMSQGEAKGKIVLGTVEGDIHDIGKNIPNITNKKIITEEMYRTVRFVEFSLFFMNALLPSFNQCFKITRSYSNHPGTWRVTSQ